MLSKTKKNALDTIFIGESYRLLNKDVIESARGVIESLPDNTLEIEVEFSLKDTVYIFWNLSKYRVKGFRVLDILPWLKNMGFWDQTAIAVRNGLTWPHPRVDAPTL